MSSDSRGDEGNLQRRRHRQDAVAVKAFEPHYGCCLNSAYTQLSIERICAPQALSNRHSPWFSSGRRSPRNQIPVRSVLLWTTSSLLGYRHVGVRSMHHIWLCRMSRVSHKQITRTTDNNPLISPPSMPGWPNLKALDRRLLETYSSTGIVNLSSFATELVSRVRFDRAVRALRVGSCRARALQ